MEFRTMNNKSGNVTLEFITAGMIASAFCLGIVAISFLYLSRQLLVTEAYFLARSQLYKNSASCEPRRSLWPTFESLGIKYQCPSPGLVRTELIFINQRLLQSEVNLRGI